MYVRHKPSVLFIVPTVAVGIDLDDRPFMELAWLCWSVGIGSLD